MHAVWIVTWLQVAASVSMTVAMPVLFASNDGGLSAEAHATEVSSPLAVVIPPRRLPHHPIRRLDNPSSSLSLADTHGSNFIEDKRTPHPAGVPMGTLSLSVPLLVTLLFALIVLATMGIAHFLYRRYARNLERAFGVHNNSVVGSHAWRFSSYNDVSNDGTAAAEATERDSLLRSNRQPRERQKSTSYYDANRSRSAAPLVIQTDMKGRPISTWSTASSVGAQRGEELSRWSKRRDELIAQYGQSKVFIGNNHGSLVEDPEEIVQEIEEDDDDRNHVVQPSVSFATERKTNNQHHNHQHNLRGEYSALEQEQLQQTLQQVKHCEHDTTYGREPAEAPGSALVSSTNGEHGTGVLP